MTPGTRLGSYEILAPLGAGGMGEVYKARDTKLGRDVAIKILPEVFVADPERVARFEREAQLLAALNHPNIAAIYGLDDAGPTKFLVLELVDGESLADRLARSEDRALQPRSAPRPAVGDGLQTVPRAIPVDEGLAIARQIVDALEAAHDKGIIHRDLKPANIMLTADGRVKVLDFGLAKLEAAKPGAAGDLTQSPTLTHMATQAGMILGTAAYMSPEQAKGRPADKRSDVWAFGAVLYEMLTGKRAFDGDDATEMIAAVVRAEPDWNALPANLPATVRSVVKRCLEKDRKNRIPDVSVVRFLLDEPASETVPLPVARSGPSLRWRSAAPWAIAGTALIAAAAALWFSTRRSSDRPLTPVRVSAETGADVALEFTLGPAVVLSPDGKTLIVVGRKPGQPTQLFMRPLDRLSATPIAGTDDARAPFFSPDAQWVAFFAAGKLKKISLTGGAAITLCDAPNGRGGAWSDDDVIAFLPAPANRAALQRVSAAGGQPQPFIAIGDGEISQRFPQFLPGGKAVLYTTSRFAASYDDGSIVVHLLSSGEKKTVVRGGYFGRYLPSGHVVYMHAGTLFAVPFDVGRLETTGPPVPVLEHVRGSAGIGFAHVAASNADTIAYLEGPSDDSAAPILWLDANDKTSLLRGAASDWSNIHFSPDGRRLALDMNAGAKNDVYTYDWERDVLTRLTVDPADSFIPIWSPDGQRVAFRSSRNGSAADLYWQRADGSGDVQRLTESSSEQHAPGSWHPSGRFLAYGEIGGGAVGPRLMILPIDGDEKSGWKPGKPFVFLEGAPSASEPIFSPDGKWIAYVANDSGRNQVFVQPFPGPGGRRQISSAGGAHPTWSRARHELFFESLDRQIYVVAYTSNGNSFDADKPRLWSGARLLVRPRGIAGVPGRGFDLHPDGTRFAAGVAPAANPSDRSDHVTLVFNVLDELKRIAPARR